MRPGGGGRLLAIILAAAVLALATGAWWILRGQEQGGGVALVVGGIEPRLQRPRAAGERPASAAAQRGWVQSALDKAWCNLPEPETVPPAVAPERRQTTAEEFQQMMAADPKYQQVEREWARVKADWIASLRSREDPHSQAAADLLDGSESAKRHLLDLGRNSSDPVLYAWAMRACDGKSSCELSAQRWVQLDPGNQMPWLWEADQAKQRGDAQAQREALYQIGLARRNDDYGRELLRLFNELREAQEPGLQMEVEAVLPTGPLFARLPPGTLAILSYCGKPATGTAPLPQPVCLGAADSLWRSADNLYYAGIALGVAKRFTLADDPVWSARRKDYSELEKRLAEAVGLDERHKQTQCDAVLAYHRHMTALASIGELAILRQLRDTSPP